MHQHIWSRGHGAFGVVKRLKARLMALVIRSGRAGLSVALRLKTLPGPWNLIWKPFLRLPQ
jgi:hypothetical protein